MPNARKNLMYESLDALCDAPDHRAMANRTIYTRAYSASSVGPFVSAKAPEGDPLSYTALLENSEIMPINGIESLRPWCQEVIASSTL